MKIRRILVVLLVMTALLLSVGSVGAYMRKQTTVVSNVFIPAEVSCEVEETFNGTEKTSITIKNTSNIEAYLRLHIVSYWVDKDGNIIFKNSPKPDVYHNSVDWLKDGDIYYYRKPVQPGETNNITTNLLQDNANITLVGDSDGNRPVVEVFAEAIQSKPTDAVSTSWNVEITKNAEGQNVITAIKEN